MRDPFEEIIADVGRMRTWMALDRDGFGKDLVKAFTDGVQECFATESDPDGSRWDELSDAYREAKEFSHPGNPIGVLDGEMSNPRQVAGVPDIIDELAIVTYGTNEQARQEAEWFQEGDPANNRPGRRFWGLTAAAEAEMDRITEKRFQSFR